MDQAGQLKSRRGMILDGNPGSEIHSLFRIGNDRYGGVGNALKYGGDLGTEIATGFDGQPLGFAAYQGFVWVMNQGKRGKVSGITWSELLPVEPPSAPTAAEGGAGPLTGDFVFYVTFGTAEGHESNPSPASNAVDVEDKEIELSNIPVSSDPQVTQRHIYGIGGALNTALRFMTVNDNTTTTATVSTSVTEAQALGIEMPVNADSPPAAAGLTGPYFGKLVAWNTVAHPNRLYWTPTAQPWKWPGANDESEGNWIDVGDESEKILGCTRHTRMLVIYKERSIWRLVGDPDTNDPEQSSSSIGAVSVRGICSVGTTDFFLGPDGIYNFNGDIARKHSVKVDPIFKGDWVPLHAPLNPSLKNLTVLEHENGRLHLAYADATTTAQNYALVYEIDSQRWSHRYSNLGGFTALFDEGEGGAFLGAVGGGLYQLNTTHGGAPGGPTDAGQAIPVIWQSRYFDQGLPDNPKVYSDLVIVHQTADSPQTPSTLTVKMFYDNGIDEEAVGSIQSSERTSTRFKLGSDEKGRRALNASVLVEGNVESTVTIFEVYLHYYVEERYAKSFDSGVVMLANGQAGEVQEIELDVTAPGDLEFSIETDLPGNTMTERATKSWGPASGRRTIRYQFPSSPPQGRRGRFFLGSDQDFQLHRFRYKVLPIGVYIDGASGEFWEPEPLA